MLALGQRLETEFGHGLAQRLCQPFGRQCPMTLRAGSRRLKAAHDRHTPAGEREQLGGNALRIERCQDLCTVKALVFMRCSAGVEPRSGRQLAILAKARADTARRAAADADPQVRSG